MILVHTDPQKQLCTQGHVGVLLQLHTTNKQRLSAHIFVRAVGLRVTVMVKQIYTWLEETQYSQQHKAR